MLSVAELAGRLENSKAGLKMKPADVQKLILGCAMDEVFWDEISLRVNLTRAKGDELPEEGDTGWGDDPKDGTGK